MDFGVCMCRSGRFVSLGWQHVEALALPPQQRSKLYIGRPACWPPYRSCWLLSVPSPHFRELFVSTLRYYSQSFQSLPSCNYRVLRAMLSAMLSFFAAREGAFGYQCADYSLCISCYDALVQLTTWLPSRIHDYWFWQFIHGLYFDQVS